MGEYSTGSAYNGVGPADVLRSGDERPPLVALSSSQRLAIIRFAFCLVLVVALLAAPVVTVSVVQERGHFTYERVDTRLHG
ncbi:hypothetical protein ABT095_15670 [Kitasatospora sp. NPDC002227]|uniref:hypothetical protein n=1 Tax=Kitasatospora sp. NPDC002227 TaxID=3154773 RepID=UPI00331DAF8D